MIIEEFKKYLKLKDLSPERCRSAKTFVDYCTANNVDYLNMTYNNIQDYFLFLKAKPWGKVQYNITLFGMRLFMKFLIETGKVNESIYDVVKKFKPNKIERKIKAYITKDELIEILQMAETFCTNMDISKLRAILCFMFYTGLRRGEMINLKRANIDLVKRTVIVKTPTKNKLERVVPFPKTITATKTQKAIDFVVMLKDYFLSEGERQNAFNMNKDSYSRLFTNLKEFAPNKKLSPHLMRHSFARMLAKAGIDSRVAQKLLGHKDIATTMIYYDPDIDTIQDLYKERIK